MGKYHLLGADMGKVVNDVPDLGAPAMIPGELGELLTQIEKEKAPERLLELAVRLQAALQQRSRARIEVDRVAING
jgi:hypothetical protein